MTIDQFLLMRHELLLILAAVIILVAEIASNENQRSISHLAIGLAVVITILGFMPAPEGTLFGGMYVTDGLRVAMKNTLNIGLAIVFLQSGQWLGLKENRGRVSEFYLLLLASIIGANYLISSGNFLMFYLSLELTTIPVAALAAYEQYKSRSSEAGIKLILSSAFSSGILLFGISIIYGMSGSLDFSQIAIAADQPLTLLGFIFFFAGLAFKISIVPFHLWTADVYEGAPTNVSAYLSVISKGAAVFVLILVFFTLFREMQEIWKEVVFVTAVLTMTIGNLFAIRQKNLKRFLAFSSIAQAGFIFLGVIGGTNLGMAATVYFVLIYVFSNLGAFGVVNAISVATGREQMADYDGLYHTNPRLSLVMMLSLFSLAGIPPVAGFFGKFFLFTAAAESGFYALLIIAVLNAIVSLYYYLLVVKAMFINKSQEPIKSFDSDFYTRLSLVICVVGMIMIGFIGGIFDHLQSISFGI